MAESSFQIIAGNGATASIVAFATTNATTFVMQSIPTDNTGAVAWGSAGSPNANIMTVQGTTSGAAVPVSGGTTSTNLFQVNGSTISLGQVTMASSFPVVLASNQSNLTTIIANASITALVSGTVSVSGLIVTAATLTSVVSTSGTPAAVAIKNASGTIYNLNLYCSNTTYPVFMKLYNITAGGVSSSVTPFMVVGISPGAANNLAINSNGLAMGGTGISYLITKFVTANDTTAVAINDLVGGLGYI